MAVKADFPFPPSHQALARAVYSRLPIVILDDVMSGLDSKTASVIVARLFGKQGHFRKAEISVVIATHSRKKTTHAMQSCTNTIKGMFSLTWTRLSYSRAAGLLIMGPTRISDYAWLVSSSKKKGLLNLRRNHPMERAMSRSHRILGILDSHFQPVAREWISK